MTQDVLFMQQNQLGVVTLNRPAALNALTLPMIVALQDQLSLWKADQSIKAVVVRAVPGTAFCAGGDVRWLYQSGIAGHYEQQMEFFRHEYHLNQFIHHFGKPYIALMDGITMGGGVGISLHGSHPVASERFVFAMPETSIGFFPDIGASYLLTRCKDSLGIYLGLTGSRLKAQDAKEAGLVQYIMTSDAMEKILDVLRCEDLSKDAFEVVDACLTQHARKDVDSEKSQIHPLISSCFAHSSVEEINQALHSARDPWTEKVALTLKQKSPLSLKLTLAQLLKAHGLSLADCLAMDLNLVHHVMQGHDFYEGVRALLIDKDNKAHWNPERLDLVSNQQIISYFNPHIGMNTK